MAEKRLGIANPTPEQIESVCLQLQASGLIRSKVVDQDDDICVVQHREGAETGPVLAYVSQFYRDIECPAEWLGTIEWEEWTPAVDRTEVTISDFVTRAETAMETIAPDLKYNPADLFGFVSAAWPYDGEPEDAAEQFVEEFGKE